MVWTGIVAWVGAGLCFVPLFDLLGYEFSAVVGTVGGVAAGVLAVGVVRQARERSESVGVGVLFVRAWLSGAATLLLPLLFIVANALRVRNCDWQEGFAFYLLIPGVSTAYGASAGTFFGLATSSSRRGTLLWLLWLTGSVVGVVLHVLFEPPKFAYHPLFGFVPGPLYDEEVSITGTLLLSRGMALLTAGGFLLLAGATHVPASQRLRWRAVGSRRLSAACCVGVFVVWGIAQAKAGALGLRPTRRDLRAVLDGRLETEHLVLFYEADALPPEEARRFADDAEFRYYQLARFFGFDLKGKVGIYLFTSPQQKKRWIGAEHTSLANPLHREVYLNREGFPHSVLKHELAHLFAGEFHPWMRLSPAIGLLEGVAVAADWSEGRLTPHQWSRAMQRLGLLPEMTRLMSPWGFWGEASSRAYTASGSFCRWLMETRGMERLARVYPTGNFARVYGESLEALHAEWQAFLRTVPLSAADLREARRRFQQRSLFQKTCAHVVAHLEEAARRRESVGDFAGARALYERLLAFEPNNPEIRWRILQTHLAAKEWTRVRALAPPLAHDPNASDLIRLWATEALADAHWRLGDLPRARDGFDAVRRADYSPELNRRTALKRAALQQNPNAQRLLRAYFDEPRADVRLYRLRELTLLEPSFALGYYLLGRALCQAEQWEDALPMLERAERLGLPDRNFRAESARWRGVALFRLRRYRAADEAFALAASLVDREGDRLDLADWRERCAWAAERSHPAATLRGPSPLCYDAPALRESVQPEPHPSKDSERETHLLAGHGRRARGGRGRRGAVLPTRGAQQAPTSHRTD